MKNFGNALRIVRGPFLLMAILASCCITAFGQTTAFTYQGKLADSGTPATGNYDFEFKLFDTAAVGTGAQQGSTVQRLNVSVANGVFTVSLDFGVCASCFNGADRFLEISVKPNGGGTLTTLAPRQPITSTPYALKSVNATTSDGLSVTCVSCVTSGQIQSVAGSQVSGAIPVASVPAGSGNYIQNTASQQASSSFNITGNGTASGTLTANIVSATTQFNIGLSRVLISPGGFNFFAGNGAGQFNTTGGSNSFFGVFAGSFNTTGGSNAFFGFEAGRNNSEGARNSYFGKDAGRSSTTGSDNAFFGNDAGQSNTTGESNSFFGKGAGPDNTTAIGNSFFGALAGNSNTTGGSNSFFGLAAGLANTTGSNNTVIGSAADVGAGNLTNATAIGFRAFVGQSNSLVLGSINGVNSSTADTSVGIGTTAPAARFHVIGNSGAATTPVAIFQSVGSQVPLAFSNGGSEVARIRADSQGNLVLATLNGTDKDIYFRAGADSAGADMFIQSSTGNVGIGNTNPTDKLQVVGNIRVGTSGTNGCVKNFNGDEIVGTCSSDARLKESITAFPATLDRLVQLRPVHFYWRAKEYPSRKFGASQSFGLIAQEVEQVMPELVTEDEEGMKAVNYSKLPILMLQAIKELKADNDALKQKLQRITQLEEEVTGLKKIICLEHPNAESCQARRNNQ